MSDERERTLEEEAERRRIKIHMNAIAVVLDEEFNGDAKGPARKTGFVLLVFPFGEKEGRCNYISNGADRKDIVKLLREQAKRFETEL